ncbi:two-component system, response regulator YesN [Paenibacillaceae bacterium GAS479]|nr:two-component system, response regulator YesN [Paenibacillaceae bacterium GAS479]
MIRILIADDEPLEREGLEWLLRDRFPGQFRYYHAASGRSAIELAEEHHPQLIFMDINMPGIKGLEAIKEIKPSLPEAKIILLTAYDYFGYAREAVSLGVNEYLVKPARRQEIGELVERLLAELEMDKRKRAAELELRHQVSRLLPLAETELALLLMVQHTSVEEAERLADWIGFPLEAGSAVVAALPSELGEQELRRVYDWLRHYVSTSGLNAACSSLIDGHAAIFLHRPPELGVDKWRAACQDFADGLCAGAERQVGAILRAGIGSLRSGADGLHRSYYEAVFASACETEKGKACHFDELKEQGRVNLSHDDDTGSLERERHSYVQAALRRSREEREQHTYSVLDRAKAYVEEKYTEDLSLEDVAEHVHLNSYYLSKILKQQFGESFIDMLTRLRIGEAKRRLDSDQEVSLKELCFDVGYKDPNYFSRVFKKVTGMTPTEYRTGSN